MLARILVVLKRKWIREMRFEKRNERFIHFQQGPWKFPLENLLLYQWLPLMANLVTSTRQSAMYFKHTCFFSNQAVCWIQCTSIWHAFTVSFSRPPVLYYHVVRMALTWFITRKERKQIFLIIYQTIMVCWDVLRMCLCCFWRRWEWVFVISARSQNTYCGICLLSVNDPHKPYHILLCEAQAQEL